MSILINSFWLGRTFFLFFLLLLIKQGARINMCHHWDDRNSAFVEIGLHFLKVWKTGESYRLWIIEEVRDRTQNRSSIYSSEEGNTAGSQCSHEHEYNGKSICSNLSLSVASLKLTGQEDSISSQQYGVKSVIPDSEALRWKTFFFFFFYLNLLFEPLLTRSISNFSISFRFLNFHTWLKFKLLIICVLATCQKSFNIFTWTK